MIRIRPEVSGLLQARDAHAVAAALQAAIELEHATIPPYLTPFTHSAPASTQLWPISSSPSSWRKCSISPW